jgi:hypothetical protein
MKGTSVVPFLLEKDRFDLKVEPVRLGAEQRH